MRSVSTAVSAAIEPPTTTTSRTSGIQTQGGDGADARAGLGPALQLRGHGLVEQDDDGVVIQLVDLGSRVGAQPVALAPGAVGDDPHAGTASTTGSFSMLRVMLLGRRSTSPRTSRCAERASDSMTACASSRASPWPAQPC